VALEAFSSFEVTKHEGNTSRASKNNVEGPLGIPFSYVKHCLFYEAWKEKKMMVYIVKEIFQLGRQLLKSSNCRQWFSNNEGKKN